MEKYKITPDERPKPRLQIDNQKFLDDLDSLIKLYHGELHDEDYTNAYCTLVTIRDMVDNHGSDIGASVSQLKGRAFSQSLDKSRKNTDGVCTRNENHDGPCNGFPRMTCPHT